MRVGARGSGIERAKMKVFDSPVEFKQTAGKWHVQVWQGGTKTVCGRHVEFDFGRIQYSGNDVVARMHPICCKQCAAPYMKEAS